MLIFVLSAEKTINLMIVANLNSELKPIIVCFVVCVELTNLSTFLLLKLNLWGTSKINQYCYYYNL